MSSPEKMLPTPQSNPNPSLPDDLLLRIFARVSRLDYPTLSLVSKNFRSLLASPELYKVRSLLNHIENSLYVCLSCNSGYRWFTLCRKPNLTPTLALTLTNDTSNKKKKKKLSSGYVLATVQIPHPPPTELSSLVAVGSNIYNIGGSISPSSSVSVLDCRSHTWREAPSLRVKLKSCTAIVLDRKIYVTGLRYKDCNPDSLMKTFEVFDTETQIWDPVSIPCRETEPNYYTTGVNIGRKFHVVTNKEMVAYTYTANENKWDMAAPRLSSYCAIENVLFGCFSFGSFIKFRWYDFFKYNEWSDLKGLVGLPDFTRNTCVRLANYGGKMAVLWDENSGSNKKIWCAEIALERHIELGIWEIWGYVEWFDHVLTVPITYALDKIIAVSF